jgi:hypothetical protein
MSEFKDEENFEGDDGYGPIRTENLKQHLKEQTPEMYDGEEMWASEEGMEEMEKRLLAIASNVWVEAAKETEEDNRRVVQQNEINNAFNNLLESHNLLMNAANKMEKLRWEFLDVAEESPMVDFEEERKQKEDE